MNLNELSQKLEDHLTDQDIQDAQELLDDTYQEIVDMRDELVEAQAEMQRLRAELEAKDESIRFLDSARLGWHELYMQKKDAIERFKAGLIRAGARVPIDAMTMNPNEQGLTAALVYLESELDRAAKRKYDLTSIVSRGEIECWSCGHTMTMEQRSTNDGHCVKCNAEIEMSDMLEVQS